MDRVVKISDDERGFSLIELIVAILIMSVVSAMVVVLISTSRNTYSLVKTDAVLQEQSEMVRKAISEIAVEASMWGEDTYNDGHDLYDFIYFYSPNNAELGLSNPADSDRYYYLFMLRPDGKLACGKFYPTSLMNSEKKVLQAGYSIPTSDENGYSIFNSEYNVIAENVSSIRCSTESFGSGDAKKLITVDLNFEYNGHTYKSSMNFAGRNRLQATPTPVPSVPEP